MNSLHTKFPAFYHFQWLTSLKSRYVHFVSYMDSSWSNVTWFSYWIFLLMPDIFTAYYFTSISNLAACPWNIYMLYLKNQTSGRGGRPISALHSLWLYMNYEKGFFPVVFLQKTYLFFSGGGCNLVKLVCKYFLLHLPQLSIAFTKTQYVFVQENYRLIEGWILKCFYS